MKVPGVRRNLVPDTWTADEEGALPKLGPCPHDVDANTTKLLGT